MPELLRLAAFDYDGTISGPAGTGIAASVLLGIEALWQVGVKTTVITARPYHRLNDISGGIHKFASEGTPLATERGARIVDGTRQKNLHYFPLGQGELRALRDMSKTNVDFIGFYSEELFGPSYIWSPETEREDALNVTFGHDAIVLAGGVELLSNALYAANPCLVTIRFKESDPANRSLLPANLNTAWTSKSVSIVVNGINKRTALDKLCLSTGTTLDSTLYAGNDENDLPVFALPDLKQKIFVGAFAPGGVAVHMKVASPNELGIHLKNMSEEMLRYSPLL